MNVTRVLVLLVLAIATDLAFRPWCPAGSMAPDPALLFLCWLAHRERRRTVYTAVLGLTLARYLGGIGGVSDSLLPLVTAVELVFLVRRRVQLQDPFVRALLLPLATVPAVAIEGTLIARPYEWSTSLLALGLAALWGAILFPILDGASPSPVGPRASL